MINISVIIPCYNSSGTIVETLKSVEGVPFDSCEVIVINDGSTDSSLKVIEEYKKESKSNIRIITQENLGVSAARNRGINESSGEFLLFLDADDLFADGYIEAVSFLMKQHAVDTLSCYRTTDLSKVVPINELDGRYVIVNAQSLLKRYTYSKVRLGFTSFVYKRSILDEYNIRFETGVKYGEDWEFATKYLSHCDKAIELNYFYYYRILDNSVSRTTSYRQIDAIHAAERTADYLEKYGHPFAIEFKEYMYNRAVFSVAHRFAKGERVDFFNQLIKDYPVKRVMKSIVTNKSFDKKSRLAAFTYLISPNCFFRIAKR